MPSPNFVFLSLSGFDANFALAPANGYTPSTAEQNFITCVNHSVAALAAACLKQGNTNDPQLLSEVQGVRNRGARELRDLAEKAIAKPGGSERDAAALATIPKCYRTEGQHREWLRRLDRAPFTVRCVSRPGNPALIQDLDFDTRDVFIPEAKAKLKTEIDSAMTVTKTVMAERERTVGWRDWLLLRHAKRVAEAQQRLSEYLSQMYGIATVGLMNVDPTQVAFARDDLDRYRQEFTNREAGVVKNRYVGRLGAVCLLAAIVCAIAYGVVRHNRQWLILHDTRNFLLLAAGTAVGTWLSFSLRRVTLTFNDLAVLEEDRLNPSLRVLFMIGLTAVVGLLFWSGAVTFGIGDLTSRTAMHEHGSWALLLGLLGGIAERALGTAVSRRATDFAVAVGGVSAPAAPARPAVSWGGPVPTAADHV